MFRLRGMVRPIFLMMYKSPIWAMFGTLMLMVVVYELSYMDIAKFNKEQEMLYYAIMALLLGVILFAAFSIAQACLNLSISDDYYLSVGKCYNLAGMDREHDQLFAETSDFRPSEASERELRKRYRLLRQQLQQIESGVADERESWVIELCLGDGDIDHARLRLGLQISYLETRLELMN